MFGAAALALGLLGPIGVVRTVIRRVAVWVVPLAVAYLAWWALTGGGLEDAAGEILDHRAVAVHQHQRRPLALLDVVQADAVDLDEAAERPGTVGNQGIQSLLRRAHDL